MLRDDVASHRILHGCGTVSTGLTEQDLVTLNRSNLQAHTESSPIALAVGDTLLHELAAIGDGHSLHYVLENTAADPAVRDGSGNTPLAIAIERGHTHATAVLWGACVQTVRDEVLKSDTIPNAIQSASLASITALLLTEPHIAALLEKQHASSFRQFVQLQPAVQQRLVAELKNRITQTIHKAESRGYLVCLLEHELFAVEAEARHGLQKKDFVAFDLWLSSAVNEHLRVRRPASGAWSYPPPLWHLN